MQANFLRKFIMHYNYFQKLFSAKFWFKIWFNKKQLTFSTDGKKWNNILPTDGQLVQVFVGHWKTLKNGY